MESTPGKVTEWQSRSRGDRWIVSRRTKVFMECNFGNYKGGWKVKLGWQQSKLAANGKSKNDGDGRSIDGFQVPSRRWRQRAEPQAKGETRIKRYIGRMETENQEKERRKVKDGTNMRIIKTRILEYNLTGMLTDERRYEKSEPNEWNDDNFKKRSKETGKIKIGDYPVGVHNTSEISGTKLKR